MGTENGLYYDGKRTLSVVLDGEVTNFLAYMHNHQHPDRFYKKAVKGWENFQQSENPLPEGSTKLDESESSLTFAEVFEERTA